MLSPGCKTIPDVSSFISRFKALTLGLLSINTLNGFIFGFISSSFRLRFPETKKAGTGKKPIGPSLVPALREYRRRELNPALYGPALTGRHHVVFKFSNFKFSKKFVVGCRVSENSVSS